MPFDASGIGYPVFLFGGVAEDAFVNFFDALAHPLGGKFRMGALESALAESLAQSVVCEKPGEARCQGRRILRGHHKPADVIGVYKGHAGGDIATDDRGAAGHGLYLAEAERLATKVAGHTENIGSVIVSDFLFVRYITEKVHTFADTKLVRLGAKRRFHGSGAGEQNQAWDFRGGIEEKLEALVVPEPTDKQHE